MLFPAQADILETEVTTATRIAELIFDRGLASVERPDDIRAWIEGQLYRPRVLRSQRAMQRAMVKGQDGDGQPRLRDVPIGIGAKGVRQETDAMGAIDVPADRYWGAQTQRSLIHFSIGDDRMPKAVYHAYGYVKKAAAQVNAAAGRLARLEGGGDRARRRRGDRRRARRELPALRLADRIGHPVEHERQRGDLEPRHPAPRRRARQQDAGAPQRRRQHGAVVERHLPHGDAHRRRGRAGGSPAAPRPRRWRRRSRPRPSSGRTW